MAETTTTPADPAEARGGTARDVQRAALRDLVAISAECAAIESEVERRHAARNAELESQSREAHSEAARRHEAAAGAGHQDYEQRVAEIGATFDNEMRAVRNDSELARRKAEHEAQMIQTAVKSEYEQAVWLAESVYDGTEAQLAVDHRKTDQRVAEHEEALNTLNTRIEDAFERFRMQVPAVNTEGINAVFGRDADFAGQLEAIEMQLARFRSLQIPRMFVGMWPYLVVMFLVALAAVGGQIGEQAMTGSSDIRLDIIGYAMGGTLVASLLVAWLLWVIGKKQVAATYAPLAASMAASRRSARHRLKRAEHEHAERLTAATVRRDTEIQSAKDKFTPMLAKALRTREGAIQTIEGHRDKQTVRIQTRNESEQRAAVEVRDQKLAEAGAALEVEQKSVQERRSAALAENENRYREEKAALQRRWEEGLREIQTPVEEHSSQRGPAPRNWEDPAWKDWAPPKTYGARVPFGEIHVLISL